MSDLKILYVEISFHQFRKYVKYLWQWICAIWKHFVPLLYCSNKFNSHWNIGILTENPLIKHDTLALQVIIHYSKRYLFLKWYNIWSSNLNFVYLINRIHATSSVSKETLAYLPLCSQLCACRCPGIWWCQGICSRNDDQQNSMQNQYLTS